MKIRGILFAMACIAGLTAAAPGARASEVLYDSIGFLTGQQSGSESFTVDGPGTLVVTLSDLSWPMPLASLDMLVSTPQSVLGPETGPGTETFHITAAENIIAQWFGTAQGSMDAGVYGLKVEWTPTSTVPLPASLALFASGLLLMAWQRRANRGTAAASLS